ncbi:MAG: hypothetical protein AB1422_02510 [bacterium]
MEERINIFLADLESQKKEVLKIYSSLDSKVNELRKNINNEDLTNSLAYKLHNLYSAYEDMFKLIAEFFENQIEGATRYHIDLLRRMKIRINGIRPNLLSDESFNLLDELRGFRHLFRHAYGYELEAERIIRVTEKAMTLKKIFEMDFELFVNSIIGKDDR